MFCCFAAVAVLVFVAVLVLAVVVAVAVVAVVAAFAVVVAVVVDCRNLQNTSRCLSKHVVDYSKTQVAGVY